MSDEWQPIETIPKGEPDEYGDRQGPIVLVWVADKKLPWTARWVQDEDEEGHICSTYSECMTDADGPWSVTLDDHPDPQYHPTHWMPAPAGPTL